MSLQDRVESLKAKHAALDHQIAVENRRPLPDTAQISVLKRQKLRIKEELDRIQHPPIAH